MPHKHLSPFHRRARQLAGWPVYSRVDSPASPVGRPSRSVLAIAYTGVRRPCICTGCICLTPAERERQRRVFKLARAYGRANEVTHH